MCRALFCEEWSTVGKREWQSSALVSPTTTLNRDVAPIGDDIEPVGESREEKSLEAEIPRVEMKIPRVEMNPKNPMSREEQEHENYGHRTVGGSRKRTNNPNGSF